jgi:hypothetical protein
MAQKIYSCIVHGPKISAPSPAYITAESDAEALAKASKLLPVAECDVFDGLRLIGRIVADRPKVA